MSENKLVGLLVLRTIDIDPTSTASATINDNEYGTITANGCVVTWKM